MMIRLPTQRVVIIASAALLSGHAEKRMKAVQPVANGRTYDIYPDRIGF